MHAAATALHATATSSEARCPIHGSSHALAHHAPTAAPTVFTKNNTGKSRLDPAPSWR
jgi:hypothetical protein